MSWFAQECFKKLSHTIVFINFKDNSMQCNVKWLLINFLKLKSFIIQQTHHKNFKMHLCMWICGIMVVFYEHQNIVLQIDTLYMYDNVMVLIICMKRNWGIYININ